MPNPGTMTSFQSFDREHINMVVQVPDYKLRQQLAMQHGEALVVEAFSAFDDLFHLHIRLTGAKAVAPELSLSVDKASLFGGPSMKLVLDLRVQSPQFTSLTSQDAGPPQVALCTWSAPSTPIEVRRSRATIPLRLDQAPAHQNDTNMSLEQTVMFTLAGMAWKLDDTLVQSLHCKSYRSRVRDDPRLGPVGDAAPLAQRVMTANLAAMMGAVDTRPDIEILLDEEAEAEAAADRNEGREESRAEDVLACGTGDDATAPLENPSDCLLEGPCQPPTRLIQGTTLRVHSFVLQAHSAVFRRMLAGPMCEATAKTIQMVGVTPTQLDDFIRALYNLSVPEDAREDEDRLLGLLSLADRYQVVALRDETSVLLESRLSEANMATFLRVADMHQAMGLRAAALMYITQRTSRIVSVMDSDDPTTRRSLREHVLASFLAGEEDTAELEAADISILPPERSDLHVQDIRV